MNPRAREAVAIAGAVDASPRPPALSSATVPARGSPNPTARVPRGGRPRDRPAGPSGSIQRWPWPGMPRGSLRLRLARLPPGDYGPDARSAEGRWRRWRWSTTRARDLAAAFRAGGTARRSSRPLVAGLEGKTALGGRCFAQAAQVAWDRAQRWITKAVSDARGRGGRLAEGELRAGRCGFLDSLTRRAPR